MQKRGTFTLGIEVLEKLRELSKTFGRTQTDILKYFVNRLHDSGISNIIAWYPGSTQLPGKEPLEGDTLLLLPDVTIKYGMVLELAIRIPSTDMSSKEFEKTLAINRDYIAKLIETIREEVGG